MTHAISCSLGAKYKNTSPTSLCVIIKKYLSKPLETFFLQPVTKYIETTTFCKSFPLPLFDQY